MLLWLGYFILFPKALGGQRFCHILVALTATFTKIEDVKENLICLELAILTGENDALFYSINLENVQHVPSPHLPSVSMSFHQNDGGVKCPRYNARSFLWFA